LQDYNRYTTGPLIVFAASKTLVPLRYKYKIFSKKYKEDYCFFCFWTNLLPANTALSKGSFNVLLCKSSNCSFPLFHKAGNKVFKIPGSIRAKFSCSSTKYA